MAIRIVNVNRKLTKREKEQIEAAAKLPVIFDEDCPELTEEQLAEMRRISEIRREERNKKVLSLRVSEKTLKKAQSLGKGYTGILSRILEEALNDPELIKRCL